MQDVRIEEEGKEEEKRRRVRSTQAGPLLKKLPVSIKTSRPTFKCLLEDGGEESIQTLLGLRYLHFNR